MREGRGGVGRLSRTMGAEEPLPSKNNGDEGVKVNAKLEAEAPLVLGLQPAALVDHVARVDWSLLNQIPGERGGSTPVLSLPPLLTQFNLLNFGSLC